MAVELGGVTIQGVTDVSVRERTRLVHHPVPGAGDLVQVLGRGAVEVSFSGVCHGPDAEQRLRRLRAARVSGEPLDFVADAVGEGFVTRVVVGALDVRQRAGRLDELGFRCTVTEYVEPPAPATEQGGLFGLDIDAALNLEALDFLDGLQNTLDQVGGLTGLLAGAPDFGDPATRLPATVDAFTSAAAAGPGLLDAVRQDVLGDVPGGVPGFADLAATTGAATGMARDLRTAVRDMAPLAPLTDALAELRGMSTVDVNGLADGLPAAMRAVDGVLRPANLEFVESIGTAFRQAGDTLANHPLLAAAGDRTLRDGVVEVLDGAATGFDARITQGVTRALDEGSVAALSAGLAAIDRMRTSFPEHRDELLPFLAENLTGLPPALLGDLHARVRAAVAVADRVDGLANDPVLSGVGALADAYDAVVAAVAALDPADPADYADVLSALDAVGAATAQVSGGLARAYDTVGVDGHDWARVLDYREQLTAAADAASGVFTFDDIVDEVTGVLDGLAAGLTRIVDADELARRGRVLTTAVRSMVDASPLSRIRGVFEEFANELVTLVERIPLDRVGAAVDDLLRRAKNALDALGIDDVATRIESAFVAVDRFVQDRLSGAVVDQVRNRAAELVARVPVTPVTDVLSGLGRVADAAEDAVTGLGHAATARLDQLTRLTDGLERLSFTPITDGVVAEIGEIRDRLRLMRSDALSDAEKLAIRVGLATLRALDVRGEVVEEVTEGYDRLDAALRTALASLRGGVDEFSGILARLQPAALLEPLRTALDEASGTVRGLSARTLVAPLRAQVRELAGELEKVRPGTVLDPLREPYAEVTEAAGRLDPDVWLRPLADVWRRIDEALGKLDVRTALAAVDERQRALLAEARRSVVDTLAGLRLPEPVATFFSGLRPAIDAMTGAVLSTPDTAVPSALLYQPVREQFDALLRPLDDVWERVTDLLAEAPEADVTAAVEELRAGLGAVDEIDPASVVARLRQARDTFAAAIPDLFLGPVLALPTPRARFEEAVRDAPPERRADVTEVLARFAEIEAGGRAPGPAQRHAELAARFAARVDALDPTPLAEPYARLRAEVDRLVPAFLLGAGPLDRSAVLAELTALRPSARTEDLDAVITQLLDRIAALRAGLDPVVADLFAALRSALGAIGPAALSGALDQVYAAVRAKLAAIDPGPLAERVDVELFQPLSSALAAVDPARLGARLDASYTAAVTALSTRADAAIDAVAGVLDRPLRKIAADVDRLLGQLRAAVSATTTALTGVLDRLRGLDLVALLDRLPAVLDRLRASFRAELDRVVRAFDEMLAAIPGGR
jgi:hypothetical protein